jgi:hypothetical protein
LEAGGAFQPPKTAFSLKNLSRTSAFPRPYNPQYQVDIGDSGRFTAVFSEVAQVFQRKTLTSREVIWLNGAVRVYVKLAK